jgi:hypothetical protein
MHYATKPAMPMSQPQCSDCMTFVTAISQQEPSSAAEQACWRKA